jgi:hypothetical protein
MLETTKGRIWGVVYFISALFMLFFILGVPFIVGYLFGANFG